MVKRINTSQFNNKIKQAQRKIDNQLKQIQRKTERKINNEIQRNISQYNRKVRANKQKIQSELRKLNRSTTTTVYARSVKQLNKTYDTISENYNKSTATKHEIKIFNYIELENMNSLSVANAIISPETSEDINEKLQDNEIGEKLKKISPDLNNRWIGALYSLNADNPEATRHFCTSTREIFTEILDKYAPDKDVFALLPNCDKTKFGNATRRSKIKYFLSKKGIDIKNVDKFIDEDINNILELYNTLNSGTHGKSQKYSIIQLKLIKKRVEDGINFLCEIVI